MSTAVEGTRRKKSLAKWLAAAAVASVPLAGVAAVGAPTPAAHAAAEFELLPPGPARVLTLSLIPGGNDDDLQGVMCEAPRTCQQVLYSYLSRSVGVRNLDNALGDGTTGQQIVFAYSEGARAAERWLDENAGQEGAPSPEELSFVLMGNPTRKYGGADRDFDTFPETEYKVLDVSREYDAASDFPDNPFNLLALLNASAGFMFTHQDYEQVDIYSPANYVWTEGNITYVFVPTEDLPLLRPLRLLGLTGLADALNGPLKEIVDRAYDRYYLPAAPGLPAPEPEPEPEPEPQAALMATSMQRSAPAAESGAVAESQPADEDSQSDAIEEDVASDAEDAVEEPAADADSGQDDDESVDEDSDPDPSTEAEPEPETDDTDNTDEPSRKVTRSKDSADDSQTKSSSRDSRSSSDNTSADSDSKDSGKSDE
ncbi:PE-PPE domain-containing protein [Mycolicibacterium hippocampi]|uniref:PE-PPE domain-containing protein n=1 Tax=Mycolicibacterium hippocampi TaxID=659824 RepID=UPI00351582C1